jgi:phage/plasmid-like protein (TIGR03299 family)
MATISRAVRISVKNRNALNYTVLRECWLTDSRQKPHVWGEGKTTSQPNKGLPQMSHELTIRQNGTVEMAYTGQVGWHGLGNELQAGASIEEWISAAGMDWRIKRARVQYATAHNQDTSEYIAFDGRVVLFRDDTKAGLGIVSNDYKVVQPREVLEFFRDLTESAGMTLETAGTLFGGKRFWAMAAIGDSEAIGDPRDKVKPYLLLSTACDGSMATEGRYTSIRVVCNNTLGFARSAGKESVKVTHRTKFDAGEVKKELGLDKAHNEFQKAMTEFRALAATPLERKQMVGLTVGLLHPKFHEYDEKKQDKVLRSQAVTNVNELAFGKAIGSGMAGTDRTAWQWLNAVTEYVDHHKRSDSVDNRVANAWFGQGEQVKERALELALATVNGPTQYVNQASHDATSSLLDAVLAATPQI